MGYIDRDPVDPLGREDGSSYGGGMDFENEVPGPDDVVGGGGDEAAVVVVEERKKGEEGE